MSTPDYATLARQFMDMWQTQMSNAMTDPGFVTAMMDTMRQPAPKSKKAKHGPKETQNPQHAPAYESRDEQLDELARRVGALEKRVRELESERAANTAKPKRKRAIRKRAVKPNDKKNKATTKRSTKSAATTKKPAAKRTSARTGGKKPTKRK